MYVAGFTVPGYCLQISDNIQPGSVRNLLMNPLAANRAQMAKRRSSRLPLKTTVGVSGEDRKKCAFTLGAKATNLNRHGAAIQLKCELLVGSTVVVRNNRGAQALARVVAQVAGLKGVRTYEIEFLEENHRVKNFWGITFPSNA